MTRKPTSPQKTRDRIAQSTRDAIRQTKPFRSLGHEAAIALLLAAEVVRNRVADVLARHGDLTVQQYNVLRILRGAGADGLPTLAIGERMVERAPGITRLLDRLEAKNLVRRLRSPADRRQVFCQITAAGLDMLGNLDAPIEAVDDASFAGLSKADTRILADLLERLRQSLG